MPKKTQVKVEDTYIHQPIPTIHVGKYTSPVDAQKGARVKNDEDQEDAAWTNGMSLKTLKLQGECVYTLEVYNMWNLKNTRLKKEKHLPNLHFGVPF